MQSALWPGEELHSALFVGVTNAEAVAMAVKGGQVEAAVLDARLVGDPFRLWMAVGKAVTARGAGKLRTRALHGDIVYNLSPKTSISDAFSTFGVTAKTTSVLVVRVGGSADDFASTLSALSVNGSAAPLAELEQLCDRAALNTIFKSSDDRVHLSMAAIKDL